MKFDKFLKKLQRSERGFIFIPKKLIGDWTKNDKSAIKRKIENIGKFSFKVPQGTTSQSFGNKAADKLLKRWTFLKNVGKESGFPDCIFKYKNKLIGVELKSTANYNIKDTNRAVLLSSTKRLRHIVKENGGPIPLCVVQSIWSKRTPNKFANLKKVNIYFLEKGSEINMRYEASSNNDLFSKYDQERIVF